MQKFWPVFRNFREKNIAKLLSSTNTLRHSIFQNIFKSISIYAKITGNDSNLIVKLMIGGILPTFLGKNGSKKLRFAHDKPNVNNSH